MSVLFLVSSTLLAQDIRSIFRAMPDSLCNILSAVNRADCIDFLESNMAAKVTNRFNKESEMTQLNDNYLHLQLTPISTFSLRLLPWHKNTPLICVVRTVEGPAKDSSIAFYTSDWQPVRASEIIPNPSKPNYFVAAELSPTNNNITFHYTSLLTHNEKKGDRYQPQNKKKTTVSFSVIYHWIGGHYKINKK